MSGLNPLNGAAGRSRHHTVVSNEEPLVAFTIARRLRVQVVFGRYMTEVFD